jgi:DNA-directed RNA polymerase specialized sigma24 family protein
MDDHPSGVVTVWLEQLKAGDLEAARPLWEGYFTRLVALARARLKTFPRAAADEEDVALSAFDSFCRGASAGRFPRLNDRDDLWQLLFVITTRKAIGLVRHATCEKRGGNAAFISSRTAIDPMPNALDHVTAAGPSPELAAEVAEECARLLDQLNDGQLRQVAIWKMEGYTNEEIAGNIQRSVPTVERKLAAIRTIWEREPL